MDAEASEERLDNDLGASSPPSEICRGRHRRLSMMLAATALPEALCPEPLGPAHDLLGLRLSAAGLVTEAPSLSASRGVDDDKIPGKADGLFGRTAVCTGRSSCCFCLCCCSCCCCWGRGQMLEPGSCVSAIAYVGVFRENKLDLAILWCLTPVPRPWH